MRGSDLKQRTGKYSMIDRSAFDRPSAVVAAPVFQDPDALYQPDVDRYQPVDDHPYAAVDLPENPRKHPRTQNRRARSGFRLRAKHAAAAAAVPLALAAGIATLSIERSSGSLAPIDKNDPLLTRTIVQTDDFTPPVRVRTVVVPQGQEVTTGALDVTLKLSPLERQRLEQKRLEEEAARAEEERLAALAALNFKITPAGDMDELPTCSTHRRGGTMDYKVFRSGAQMKALNLTLDTPIAVAPEGCKITLRAAFEDVRIDRIPFVPVDLEYGITPQVAAADSKRLFEQWAACLGTYGFNNTVYRSAEMDRGLAFAPSEAGTHETARGEVRGTVYACSVSWGRDRVHDSQIARLIKRKLPLPQGDWAGANGSHQLMYMGMYTFKVNGEVVNPFDPAQASAAARLYLQDIARNYGNNRTSMMIVYNGGPGALLAARRACGSTKLRPDCVENQQTRIYAFGRATRGKNTEVAAEEPTGFFQMIFGTKRAPARNESLAYN